MMLRTGFVAIALAAAGPALAQAPDLAKLSAELTAKESAVQKATARPATWAARAREFKTWLAAATDDEGKPLDAAARAGHITDQIHTLDKELGRAKGITATASQAEILGDKCLAKWLIMNCLVPMAGVLREHDGTRILWQLQSGASEEDGGGMGAMLWDAADTPRLIGWTFEGAWMEAPRYEPERQLLWVAGRMVGTGDGNADILFQRQGGKWVEIDLGSWRADLDKRLPKGLGAWHGVDYDLTSLSAETELWKDSDANCCATGGRANLDFEIVGATLKLKGISAQTDGPGGAWKDY
ncbi:MAG: hypothetical protein EOP60_07910 [Sphingomonadales bacterium]|nr:MAG: hypothetical protein EOP60_07910 [Sphingomonadales bacterium]